MGREADCIARWRSQEGRVRAILESDALILRGPIKARLGRRNLTGFEVQGESLRLWTGDEVLELDLGAVLAARWQSHLMRPLPTLREKLGISADVRAFVLGSIGEAALAAALEGCETQDIAVAQVLVAELRGEADLSAALALALSQPALAIWCVYPKGKNAHPSDPVVRAQFRAAGLVDTKSTAVSAQMSATRYQMRKQGDQKA